MKGIDPVKVREYTRKMVDGEWKLLVDGQPVSIEFEETFEILTDPDAMKAIGEAENQMVLENFAKAIINLAQEAELWEGSPETRLTHEQLFYRVGNLMEQALKDRAMIRAKYKVSLLPPEV